MVDSFELQAIGDVGSSNESDEEDRHLVMRSTAMLRPTKSAMSIGKKSKDEIRMTKT